MSYRMFYTDYCEDKNILSSDAVESTVDEIIQNMKCVLQIHDNFLGIIDQNNTTLQFMVEETGMVYLDMPIPEKNGSFSNSVELSECIEIVRSLRGEIDINSIKNLEFSSWGKLVPETKPWWKFW